MAQQIRQLAAIMFTDIVGYTALMGKDAAKALELVRISKEIQKPLVEKQGGQWLKEMGDGALVKFTTASDAVKCAIEIQEMARAKFDGKLRIGIHLGDIIFENNDVYGDGVNVAARLESAADPGGIYISESIEKAIRGQSDIQSKYLGEINLKNVDYGVRTYAIQGVGLPIPDLKRYQIPVSSSSKRKFSLAAVAILTTSILGYALIYFKGVGSNLFQEPGKSIAVLPFENMNRDSTQDYFSNGIAEDILNHLVKIADLKVKSRTSTLQYKGTTKTMSEIGDELNVSNVLEGSVRRVGDKVRIVVQLIDTKTDTHLWSETYDRDLKDVLSLQSEISLEIARALQARLTLGEKSNIQKQASQNITAYDYLLKARDVMNRTNGERRDVETAIQLMNQAIQLDSGLAQAYAYKGSLWFTMHEHGVSQHFWQDSAMYFSSKAIALDPASPHGYQVRGRVYQYFGKQKEAKEAFYKAYQASPNDPTVLNYYGLLLLRERDETGASLVLKSLEAQYSPKDPEYYQRYGNLYLTIGEIATAEELFRKYKSVSPGAIGPYLSLANLYAQTGQFEKAILEAEQAEKINPTRQIMIDDLAWLYYWNNDLEKAARYWLKLGEIESGFDDSTQIVPFRHRLGMVYSKMGRKKEADALVAEDLKKYSEIASGQRGQGTWYGPGPNYYSLAVDHAYFGNDARAVQYLDSALQREFNWFRGYRNDPMFSNLRKREDFKKILKKVNDRESFLKQAWRKALNQAEAGKELKRLMEK